MCLVLQSPRLRQRHQQVALISKDRDFLSQLATLDPEPEFSHLQAGLPYGPAIQINYFNSVRINTSYNTKNGFCFTTEGTQRVPVIDRLRKTHIGK